MMLISVRAQIRVGILSLAAETGQWKSTPLEDRTCELSTIKLPLRMRSIVVKSDIRLLEWEAFLMEMQTNCNIFCCFEYRTELEDINVSSLSE